MGENFPLLPSLGKKGVNMVQSCGYEHTVLGVTCPPCFGGD